MINDDEDTAARKAKKNADAKRYYREHRSERLAYAKKHQKENKENINKYRREYYNTEEWKKYQKDYYQNNKHKWIIDTPEKRSKKNARDEEEC